jgi:hypothetical protein
MKQQANWRGARLASLVPNVLPTAEAAACVLPVGSCWCHFPCSGVPSCISFGSGSIHCTTCNGGVRLALGRCV